MSELSSDAKALIELTRDCDEPRAADRDRMRSRLVAELGVAAFTGAAIAAGAAAPASVPKLWLKGAGKLLAVAAAAGGVYLGSSWLAAAPATRLPQRGAPAASSPAAQTQATRAPTPASPAERAPDANALLAAEPTPSPDLRAAPASSTAPRPERAKRSAKARTARGSREAVAASAARDGSVAAPSTLAAELALLARAQQALREGAAQAALAHTREHAAQFPSGLLADERTSIELLARCAMGEGREAAQEFLARAGDSPLAARVRGACKLP